MTFWSCKAHVIASTRTAIYSHTSSDCFIYMSGSALHSKNPISRRSSENVSCHCAPLERRLYDDLYISNIFSSFSSNSCPEILQTCSGVCSSSYAFLRSVDHISRWFDSARNIIIRKLRNDTTPEYTLYIGTFMICTSATHLELCLMSYLT